MSPLPNIPLFPKHDNKLSLQNVKTTKGFVDICGSGKIFKQSQAAIASTDIAAPGGEE